MTRRRLYRSALSIAATLVAFRLAMLAPTGGRSIAEPTRAAPSVLVRRPVAAAPLGDGRHLLVANRRSGSISLVDCDQGVVVDELTLGGALESLAGPLPARRDDAEADTDDVRWLAVDSQHGQLIEFSVRNRRLARRSTLATVSAAQSATLAAGGRRACVAGMWSHTWQAIEWTNDSPRAGPVLRLSFAPRAQCVLPDDRHVLVADAFGGRMALIDSATSRQTAEWSTPLHNVRRLSLSSDRRFVELVHQRQFERAAITRDAVATGQVVRHELSRLSVESLAAAGMELSLESTTINAADPSDLAQVGDVTCITAAGTDELVLRSPGANEPPPRRVAVGARPLVVAPLSQLSLCAVVSTLDDAVTVVDARSGSVVRRISLGLAVPPSPKERGERLFFDARLSAGRQMSCHSCHTDGHTHGRLADTSGDDSVGSPKRTLTLLGTGLTYRWAWNGTQANLHDQVVKSLATTLHGDGATFQNATDLVAFLHSLPPPPPMTPAAASPADALLFEHGRLVFERRQCGQCHIPPLVYSSHESYDVGIEDERGLRKFNPPSLRGASQLTRWLHDNRAVSLRDVFVRHGHPNDAVYSDEEATALVRFLEGL
ncbi:MAG: cytochrome c peroxidase [Pirellulales bacterium]